MVIIDFLMFDEYTRFPCTHWMLWTLFASAGWSFNHHDWLTRDYGTQSPRVSVFDDPSIYGFLKMRMSRYTYVHRYAGIDILGGYLCRQANISGQQSPGCGDGCVSIQILGRATTVSISGAVITTRLVHPLGLGPSSHCRLEDGTNVFLRRICSRMNNNWVQSSIRQSICKAET